MQFFDAVFLELFCRFSDDITRFYDLHAFELFSCFDSIACIGYKDRLFAKTQIDLVVTREAALIIDGIFIL